MVVDAAVITVAALVVSLDMAVAVVGAVPMVLTGVDLRVAGVVVEPTSMWMISQPFPPWASDPPEIQQTATVQAVDAASQHMLLCTPKGFLETAQVDNCCRMHIFSALCSTFGRTTQCKHCSHRFWQLFMPEELFSAL